MERVRGECSGRNARQHDVGHVSNVPVPNSKERSTLETCSTYFITDPPSLIGTMQPIQYQSCFISDSSQDEKFARRLHEKMRGEKLRVWFALEDMQGDQKLIEQIDRAIQVNACCWYSRNTA